MVWPRTTWRDWTAYGFLFSAALRPTGGRRWPEYDLRGVRSAGKMTQVQSSLPVVSPSRSESPTGEAARVRSPWLWVAALAAAAALCWLPFLGRTPSPDEGGLLTVAGQWAPGSSLYGDYWVDRPPLLIGLFALADGLGGALALRVLGLVAVVAHGRAGGRHRPPGRRTPGHDEGGGAARRRPPRCCWRPRSSAAPWSARSCWACRSCWPGSRRRWSRWSRADRTSSTWWAIAAGAAGAAAFLVKQNIVDVAVFVAVMAALSRRRAAGLRLVGGAAVGAVAMTAVVLGVAATRGTGPAGVWDAVVVFRAEAAGIIAQSDNPATGKRLGGVLVALVFSGAPLLAGALARTSARGRATGPSPAGLRYAAWALLAWEMFVVLVGGGYWLHYLMGLVPGLVVLAAASARASPRRYPRLVAAYAYTACSTVAVLCWVLVNPIERPEEPAIAYLAAHARPGDTAVVAFGTPNILQGAGLQSPYPQLWSLPARVRDPQARELADVLTGPEAPTWLVVSGRSVTTWGIDGAAANRIVRVALRAGGERRQLPDLRQRRSARDRGPRRRPSPDAHASPRAGRRDGRVRGAAGRCGAW